MGFVHHDIPERMAGHAREALDKHHYRVLKMKIGLDPKEDIISLHMDKESAFQYFVDLIDILKAKEFKNISILTKP